MIANDDNDEIFRNFMDFAKTQSFEALMETMRNPSFYQENGSKMREFAIFQQFTENSNNMDILIASWGTRNLNENPLKYL